MKRNKEPLALVWKHHKYKYMLIAPFAIVFLTFTFLPIVVSIFFSFTSFNMVKMPEFTGLTNYINLLVRDEVFLIAIKNTLLLALVTGPISYILCFLLAWLINELPPLPRSFITLVFYAPTLSGNAYLVWKLIFSSNPYGYVNATLLKLGWIKSAILFFENEKFILPLLIIIQIWISLGVAFLAFIAGLQNVNKELYEAASVEGIKNRWQELWFITLPSMKPQLLFGAVMQITGSLSIGQISIDLAGFPSKNNAGHTILTHLHDYGNIRYELGYACTIAVVLFFIMMLCNIIVQKLLRKVG